MSLQRRIVTSHESPSRSSSPPPLSQSRRLGGGGPSSSSKGEYASLNNPSSLEYNKSASRKRVLFILGPILFILFIIHLLSPSSSNDLNGSNGRNHLLPGFGPRSTASRRTDRINAARQRQKSAASGEWRASDLNGRVRASADLTSTRSLLVCHRTISTPSNTGITSTLNPN